MIELNIEKLAKNCKYCAHHMRNDLSPEQFNNLLETNPNAWITILIGELMAELKKPLEDILEYFPSCNKDTLDFNAVKQCIDKITYSVNLCDKCPERCQYAPLIDHVFHLSAKVVERKVEIMEYPIFKFPAPISEYILQLSRAMVAPPQFIATSILAVLAVLCSRFAEVQATPTWTIPLNGYFLNVGDVSTKKSPSMKKALEPLYLIMKKEDRLITNDSTSEALQILLKDFSSILLHLDEANVLDILGGYTKTANAGTARILKLYTGQPDYIDRKGQEPIIVEKPRLSILAGVQPSVLKTSKGLTACGMLQRFMISYVEGSNNYYGCSKNTVDEDVANEVTRIFKELYEKGSSHDLKLTLTDEAFGYFQEYQNEIYKLVKDIENEDCRDYYGKYFEHVLKIAGLIHLVQNESEFSSSTEITKATLILATDIAKYYEMVARNLFLDEKQEDNINTNEGYKQLLSIAKAKEQETGEIFTFNPTYLNKSRIGGCDARKPDYTNKFIDKLIDEFRCIEETNVWGKGRIFYLIKE